MVCEQENRWTACDLTGLTIWLFNWTTSLSPFVCLLCVYSPFLLFVFLFSSSPSSSSLASCANCCHTSVSPPAGVRLVKSGGCGGSSQSCKWGSSPGWPRHSIVQVRKPATLPTTTTTNSGGRDRSCVPTGTDTNQTLHFHSREKKGACEGLDM